MSNYASAAIALKAFRVAAFAAIISLCVIIVAPAAERTAPQGALPLLKPASLQKLPSIPPSATATATPAQRQRAVAAFDLSPAVFVENKGQWDSEVRYGFDGKGTRVSFTDAGPVFQMLARDGESGETSQTVFSATFVGAKKVQPVGLDQSPSTTNYYIGKDPAKWQSGVPAFTKVAYKGLYEGVDLYTWGKRSGLKYEFHVAPGASWERIVIRYHGIESLSLDGAGALHVKTPLGEIVDGAPLVYQETPAGRAEISARFVLVDKFSYAFDITGAIDPSLPIVIDPELVWSSYLGGSGNTVDGEASSGYEKPDYGYAIAVDASGNCYVTGLTASSDFPTPGGFDTTYNGDTYWSDYDYLGDAFVAKVTSSGQLEWASYLGGSDSDVAYGIAVDASGNCYVTGSTTSLDFPVPGGFDTSFNGGFYSGDEGYNLGDAFVAKVTSSGQLAWASYLGGGDDDCGYAIAADASGNCYVTGWVDPMWRQSSDFPTPGGFDTTFNGGYDAFVAKVTSSGLLEWASYLGGSSYDQGRAIALDASGNCYVAGTTQSADFPTPGGFDTTILGFADSFLAKVTSSGELAWASYLGARYYGYAPEIAADASGNCYVFMQTDGLHVVKVTASGQIDWTSSYFGGSQEDWVGGIAVDASGSCYVTGGTQSPDFPTPGGFDTSYNDPGYGSGGDVFVAKLTSSGQLEWGSYLGGTNGDYGHAIAVDASGNCYVTGETWSLDFPTPGGFDTSFNAPYPDAFVARISSPLTIATTTLPEGIVGTPYGATLEAVGGVEPYAWSIASGTLPAGLSLDSSTGVIDGTPTAAGTSDFTVKLTDARPIAVTREFFIEVYPDPPPSVSTWLEITKFRLGLPAAAGRDSIALRGMYNWRFTVGAWPPPVTVTVGDWSVTIEQPAWKQVGKSSVYRFKQGDVAGRISFCVRGTTKCLLSLRASNQTLQGRLPQWPAVPVRLQCGADFDETVLAGMTQTNNVARLTSVGPLPLFYPERIRVTRNFLLASHDRLAFKGKVFLDGDFDPATDAVAMHIGLYEILLPAGTISPAKNGIVAYTAPTANGKLVFTLNNKTHALKVTATGIDMSAVTRLTGVSLSIANHPGADWDYGLIMARSKSHKVYTY